MVRKGVTGTVHGKGQPKILIRSASLKENTVWTTYDIKRHGLTLVQQADSSLWLPRNPFTISLLLLLLPPLPGLILNALGPRPSLLRSCRSLMQKYAK